MESMEFQEGGNSSNLQSKTDNSQPKEGELPSPRMWDREIAEVGRLLHYSDSMTTRLRVERNVHKQRRSFDLELSSPRTWDRELAKVGRMAGFPDSMMTRLQGERKVYKRCHSFDSEDERGEEIGKRKSTVNTTVSCIEKRLDTLPEFSTSLCSIYRVPKPLREVNEKAYTPLLVSIGPFHYQGENLHPMDDQKLQCLRSFLSKSKGTLQSYVKLVERFESIIRQYYANPTTNSDHESFIQMFLLESIFIIQVLRSFWSDFRGDDCMPGLASKRIQLERDLMLAENQLPFFILCDLYRVAFNPDRNRHDPFFTDMACKFFGISKERIPIDSNNNEAKCHHLLDMLRKHYMPSNVKRGSKANLDMESTVKIRVDKEMINIMSPSATSLHQAGVKFVADENAECLLDIKFNEKKGILTIPKLRLDNRIEVLLLNLIAFEQCHCSDDTYWTYYQRFMNFLINTPQDVKLLVKAGIIENLLGSNEDACNLFKITAKETEFNPNSYHYKDISRQLNHHCKRTLNHYRAILAEKFYFDRPWAALSWTYASVLLILTIIQVVTGIIPLLRHNNKVD